MLPVLRLWNISILNFDDAIAAVFQGTYVHHKQIKAAQGIKITAQVM